MLGYDGLKKQLNLCFAPERYDINALAWNVVK